MKPFVKPVLLTFHAESRIQQYEDPINYLIDTYLHSAQNRVDFSFFWKSTTGQYAMYTITTDF